MPLSLGNVTPLPDLIGPSYPRFIVPSLGPTKVLACPDAIGSSLPTRPGRFMTVGFGREWGRWTGTISVAFRMQISKPGKAWDEEMVGESEVIEARLSPRDFLSPTWCAGKWSPSIAHRDWPKTFLDRKAGRSEAGCREKRRHGCLNSHRRANHRQRHLPLVSTPILHAVTLSLIRRATPSSSTWNRALPPTAPFIRPLPVSPSPQETTCR